MKKYFLEIIVFICGAVVMILELVGSRVLAPYLGTSIFVWTSLIGIILGSLSLGYWWGGRIADKQPDFKTLALLIFLSAALTGLIALVKEPILIFLQNIPDIRIKAILATIILFAPASIILGMVSPYAVKLKMRSLTTSGATVGELYAISTIGSIFGTFLAGFFLIAHFGNTKILIVLAITLTLTSILAGYSTKIQPKIFLLLICALGLWSADLLRATQKQQGIIDIDTQYARVLIYESRDYQTGRPIRNLATNPREVQSAMFLDKDDELVFTYTKYYRLAEHFNPEFKKALLIGGGAFSFPKDYLKRYPAAALDVVEIDPQFTILAKEYFNLKDDPRLNVYQEDGRTFINKTSQKYDVVYVDAFRSFYTVPYHLTTRETAKKLYNALNEDGVVLLNIISSIEGEKSDFLRAEYATYKNVFPQVYLLPVQDIQNNDGVRNIMLVALKSERPPSWSSTSPELNKYLGRLWNKEIPADLPILTDDFAPVDQYIMKLM